VLPQFGEGSVGTFGESGVDRVAVALVKGDAAVERRPGSGLAGGGPPLLEATDPGFTDAIGPGHGPSRLTFVESGEDPIPHVLRVRSHESPPELQPSYPKTSDCARGKSKML
jgi:hypothetical protein